MDPATLIQLGGMFAGGLLGGQDSTQSATTKQAPWEPAQPYILDNLKDTAALKDYYKQNPFNQQQQTSYQNLFGDLDNFRQNTAPGLMNFANNAMTSNYQRQRGGAPGSGAGYGGLLQPGGNTMNTQPRPFSVASGPSSTAPSTSYGLLDFKAQNPMTNGAIPPRPTASSMPAGYGGSDSYGGGGDGSGGSMTNSWDGLSNAEKAAYYAANPTMAAITQMGQKAFGLTAPGMIQAMMTPGFVTDQNLIAMGVDPVAYEGAKQTHQAKERAYYAAMAAEQGSSNSGAGGGAFGGSGYDGGMFSGAQSGDVGF